MQESASILRRHPGKEKSALASSLIVMILSGNEFGQGLVGYGEIVSPVSPKLEILPSSYQLAIGKISAETM